MALEHRNSHQDSRFTVLPQWHSLRAQQAIWRNSKIHFDYWNPGFDSQVLASPHDHSRLLQTPDKLIQQIYSTTGTRATMKTRRMSRRRATSGCAHTKNLRRTLSKVRWAQPQGARMQNSRNRVRSGQSRRKTYQKLLQGEMWHGKPKPGQGSG